MDDIVLDWKIIGNSVIALREHALPAQTSGGKPHRPKLAVLAFESLIENLKEGDTLYTITSQLPAENLSSLIIPHATAVLSDLRNRGYDITLLTCVEEDTRKKTKKSRPPQNGSCQFQEKEQVPFTKPDHTHHSSAPNTRHSTGAREASREQTLDQPTDTQTHPLILAHHSFLRNIELLLRALSIPVSVYISLATDMYQLPARGMFDLALDAYYDLWRAHSHGSGMEPPAVIIDPVHSFYCGPRSGIPLIPENPDSETFPSAAANLGPQLTPVPSSSDQKHQHKRVCNAFTSQNHHHVHLPQAQDRQQQQMHQSEQRPAQPW